MKSKMLSEDSSLSELYLKEETSTTLWTDAFESRSFFLADRLSMLLDALELTLLASETLLS